MLFFLQYDVKLFADTLFVLLFEFLLQVLYKFLLPQIPAEEKDLGPQDRMVHVYHFLKDTAQNQMVRLNDL